MRFPVLRSFLVAAAILTGVPLSAQFSEVSATVLFEKSIGISSHLFGYSVVPLGDVSGDGVLDMAVAAPFSPGGSAPSAGRVYGISGADGSTLWERFETRRSAIMGYSLEAMDWNGDGKLDVVTGAPFSTPGKTWIYSGVDGSTLAQLSVATARSLGAAVLPGGDLDGDGTEDLVVAAPFTDTGAGLSSGRVYVYKRGSTAPYASFDGPAADSEFGLGLAWVGDTNGDGRDELAVGHRDPNDFFAGFATVFEWNGASVDARYTVSGVGMGYNLLGDRMDGGRDVSGDGIPDFLVGDMFASVVKVFSGDDGRLLDTFNGLGDDADVAPARMISDFDGDGVADIVAGGWQSSSGAPGGGRVFVYSAVNGHLLKAITSTRTELNVGIDVREMGDFDGDGKSDLLIGAYGDGFNGPLPGAAIVISGDLPERPNASLPAELASDPWLIDSGGDAAAGPIAGSATEVFNLALDCSSAPQPGRFTIQVRLLTLNTPVTTRFGRLWIAGNLLFRSTGLHNQDVVQAVPGGLVLPADPALIGRVYGVQGLCGGRFSNAVQQTIGG